MEQTSSEKTTYLFDRARHVGGALEQEAFTALIIGALDKCGAVLMDVHPVSYRCGEVDLGLGLRAITMSGPIGAQNRLVAQIAGISSIPLRMKERKYG